MFHKTVTIQPHYDTEVLCGGDDCTWSPDVELMDMDRNRKIHAQARAHAKGTGHDVVLSESQTRSVAFVTTP